MNLTVRANELVVRLAKIELTRSLAQEGDSFRTRADQLTVAIVDLQGSAVLHRAMEGLGIRTGFDASRLHVYAARARAVREAFIAKPKSILVTNPPLDKALLEPLRSISADIRIGLTNAWRAEVERILGPVSDDFLRLIQAIPKLAPFASNVRKIQEEGARIGSTLPPASLTAIEEALAKVRSLKERKAGVMEKLEGIPEEVMAFLGRVTNGNARLSEVTVPIREWLSAEGLLNAFRVVIG